MCFSFASYFNSSCRFSYLCRTSSPNTKSATSLVRPRTQRTCAHLRISLKTCRPATTTATSSALWMWWGNVDTLITNLSTPHCDAPAFWFCVAALQSNAAFQFIKRQHDEGFAFLKYPNIWSSRANWRADVCVEVEVQMSLVKLCGQQHPQFSGLTHKELKPSQTPNKPNDVLLCELNSY